jgi:hypothetical protein
MHAPTGRGLSSAPDRLSPCVTTCLLRHQSELQFSGPFCRIYPVDAVSVSRRAAANLRFAQEIVLTFYITPE